MLVNLTPHALNIIVDDEIIVLRPSGEIARVSTVSTPMDPVDGIPVVLTGYAEVEGLPEPQPDTYYIVSRLVLNANAISGRQDVLAPGELVRDDDGKPIGCNGLSR
jgi:hypothetical protein